MSNDLVIKYEVDGNQITLTPEDVQSCFVQGGGMITVAEFKMFVELCKRRNLDPFRKEAYCIKYGDNPAQLIVGKDAILRRAIRHPDYDGMESGIIARDKNTGTIIERQGSFYITEQETVVGGWARVYRKNWSRPIYTSVAFNEVAQSKKGGGLNTMWSSKGATMVEKVAKVRALRETFVEELGGMYEAEEMGVELNQNKSDIQEKPQVQEEIIQQDEPIDVVAVPVEEATFVSFDEL